MSVYVHKLLKDNNSFLLLHSLYTMQSATMYDLVEETHLSQSSVRNLLRKFEEVKLVESIGIDQSTGGRCPVRFSLVPHAFTILCCYVHKDFIDYTMIRLYETIEEGQIHYKDHKDAIDQLKSFCQKYPLQCFVIAVEGIVNGHRYYTDHDNNYDTNLWIEELQKDIDIPVYVENDVKVMQEGIYKENRNLKNFVYLYINQLGMSCSIMMNGELLQGSKGIIGELGLLPYEEMTINQALRICKKQDEFDKILMNILAIICTSLDPEKILIATQLPYQLNMNDLRYSLQNIVYQNYQLEHLKEPIKKLFNGLEYIGMTKILKTRIGAE